ncbi:MAG: alpha/beta fold hydrolase [Pseudomonadota bacterium]
MCALILAGCAGGPLGDAQPLGKAVLNPPMIVGSTGRALPVSQWRAEGAERAVILAVHGFGGFGPSTFEPAARAWAGQGITTYAYDQRGFGRNDDWKRWPGARVLIDDVRTVARSIKAAHPGVPLVVLGHSMGGGLVAAAAGSGLQADGIVLGAPAMLGYGELNPLLRASAFTGALLFPDRRLTGRGVVRFYPTDNLELAREVVRHPRYIADASPRELFGLVLIMDKALAAAPDIPMPSLTLIGANDQILSPRAMARVQRRIGGPAQVITYPQGWHWVFRDRQAARVWDDTARFALGLGTGAS